MLYRHNDQLTTMQNFMQIDFFNNLHNLQQQCNNSRLANNKKNARMFRHRILFLTKPPANVSS